MTGSLANAGMALYAPAGHGRERLARAACLAMLLSWLAVAWRGRTVLGSSTVQLLREAISGRHGVWLAIPLAVALALFPSLLRRLARIPSAIFLAAAAAASVVIAHEAQLHILRGVPQIPDEFGYLLQIKTFAHGALAAPSPSPPAFFYASWSMHHNGHWVAMFPPGFALLATPFALFGHVNLANPCIGAGVTALLYLLARDLFGDAAARLATLLWLGSEFRFLNDASWMSHPTAALLGLASVLCAFRALGARSSQRRSGLYALGAGAALACLGLTRPLNGVIVALSLSPIIALRLHGDWRRTLRALGLAALAVLPFAGAFAVYCHAVTGSATRLPETAYFAAKEEQTDCYRLGFGKTVGDCEVTQGRSFPDGYSPRDALTNTDRRVAAWSWNVFGSGALLLLALVPLALAAVATAAGANAGGGISRAHVAFAAMAATLQPFAYALFFYHGVLPEYGARFLYESTPYAVMLYALAVVLLARGALGRPDGGPRTARRVARRLLGALPIGAWLILHLAGAAIAANRFYPAAHARPNSENGAVDRLIANSPGVHHALVLTQSCCLTPLYLEDPVHLDRNDLLFVRDLGPRANRELLRHFPDRRPYVLGRDRLVPYRPGAWMPPDDLYFEVEHFGADLLSGRVHAFARHLGDPRASGGAYLGIHASEPGGYVELTLDVPWTRSYKATLRFLHDPGFGTVRVALDGIDLVGEVIEATRPFASDVRVVPAPLALSRGPHVVRLQVVAPGPAPDSLRGALDSIELAPVE